MGSKALSQPMIDRLIPIRSDVLRVPLQIIIGVGFMALLAQFRIELGPVPITGQTLGALLLGAAYGVSLGTLTLVSYLLVGGLGLGVFTGGASGWATLTGATAGYLFGFVLAAAAVGYLAQRGWDREFSTTALAMFFGTILIYLPGMVWLSTFAPDDQPALLWAFSVGVLPFLIGDTIKLLIAAGLLPIAWRLLGKRH